ncbi:MAG: xanthine dehydrogenase family protein molybdopterin-binding subunit, partial [Candidatus Tectomicrobia bacterium]
MTSTISGAPVTPGKLVGQRVKRTEDPRLIRGQATYVDDITLPGMLHLAFKRSDIAHGKILTIDTSRAEALPGVVMVATGADLKDRLAPMPVITPFPKPDHWPITWDKVRFVGDPVAVVVARDRYIARDAVDAIQVEIEALPAVIDPERAMQGEPALVHDDFPHNIAVNRLLGGTDVNRDTGEHDDRKINEAFASAEVIISQRMLNQRLAPTCMEARGVLAHYDPGAQALTVWSSTQTPHWVKSHLAAGLGLGEHHIRVIAPEVGGGFGAKKIYGEDYVAAALSVQLGAPVKWIENRTEAFMTTTHGRGQMADVEIAAQRDGTVLGVRVRIIADIGAYQMLATAFVPTLTMGLLSGLYTIPAIRAELHEVYTNKMPTDAYRGAGRPESIYYIERAMDMLARELDMDPAALRRKNFIQPEQFPFRTQAGSVYDSGEYERLLDQSLRDANWEQLKADRDAARAAGRLVGLGLACYVEVCGLGPSSVMPTGGWEYASVSVERSGKISATTGSSAHGQGHETTFAQLLSDELGGIPLEDIAILHGDTAVARHGIGTFGSRSQAVGGTALMQAAGKVRAKMAKFAATMLEAQEEDIVFADHTLFVKGVPQSAI